MCVILGHPKFQPSSAKETDSNWKLNRGVKKFNGKVTSDANWYGSVRKFVHANNFADRQRHAWANRQTNEWKDRQTKKQTNKQLNGSHHLWGHCEWVYRGICPCRRWCRWMQFLVEQRQPDCQHRGRCLSGLLIAADRPLGRETHSGTKTQAEIQVETCTQSPVQTSHSLRNCKVDICILKHISQISTKIRHDICIKDMTDVNVWRQYFHE